MQTANIEGQLWYYIVLLQLQACDLHKQRGEKE
jgi:hypothetical protein